MAASCLLSSTAVLSTLAPSLPQNPPKALGALGHGQNSCKAPFFPAGVPIRIQTLRLSHGSVRCGAMQGGAGGDNGYLPVTSPGAGGLADLVRSIFRSPNSLEIKRKEKRKKNLELALSRLEEHRHSLMETSYSVIAVDICIVESISRAEAFQNFLIELLPEIERLEQKIEGFQDPTVVLLKRIRKLNLAFSGQHNNSGAIAPPKAEFHVPDAGVGSESKESAIEGNINLFFMLKKDKVNDFQKKVKELQSRLGLSFQLEKPHLLEELDKKLKEAMSQKEHQEHLDCLIHEMEMLCQDLSDCEDKQWNDSLAVLSQKLDELDETLSSLPDGYDALAPSLAYFKTREFPKVKTEILNDRGEAEAELGHLHQSGSAETRRFHGKRFGNIIQRVKAWMEARRQKKNSSTFSGVHELHSLADHLGNGLWVLHGKPKGLHLWTDYNLVIDLEEDMEATLLKVEEFLIERATLLHAYERLDASVNKLLITRDALLDGVESLLQEITEVRESLSSYADITAQDFPNSAEENEEGWLDRMGSSHRTMNMDAGMEPVGHAV